MKKFHKLFAQPSYVRRTVLICNEYVLVRCMLVTHTLTNVVIRYSSLVTFLAFEERMHNIFLTDRQHTSKVCATYF